MMKKILGILVAAMLLASLLPAAVAEETASGGLEALIGAVAEEARMFVINGDGDWSMYRNMRTADAEICAGELPAALDLRDRGVVPPVRDQGDWGTCWDFAAVAASEISMLSSMGLTTDAYKESMGRDMNLSERHLGWFGTSHLPLLEAYPEGEYPYSEDQAGEGIWHSNEDTKPAAAHLGSGGCMGYVSSVFANGVGPVPEELVPYMANDGTSSLASDWSLPEEQRVMSGAELANSNILPCPSIRDADGSYVYDPAGTEAIKEELMAGRAVSIAYHADHSVSPDAKYNKYRDDMLAEGIPEEYVTAYLDLAFGKIDPSDATEEQKHHFVYIMMFMQLGRDMVTEERVQKNTVNFDMLLPIVKATYANQGPVTVPDSPQVRAALEILGISYEDYAKDTAASVDADRACYINYDTFAHYTFNENARSSHAVTIVGWDDSYAVENFLPGQEPPAPGAWLVRNSWNDTWGNDGYFWLSYYDRSICIPESFEFLCDNDMDNGVAIYSYDNMQVSSVSAVMTDTPVYLANVFPVGIDGVISYVSVLTADLNTGVTVSVYLLNEESTSPVDGTLLDTVTQTVKYAGYHRIALNDRYALPAGSLVSIVQTQQLDTADGACWCVPFTGGLGREGSMLEGLLEPTAPSAISWFEGRIGESESFVGLGDEWADWKAIVDAAKAVDPLAALLSFDNLNIKLYFYLAENTAR